MQLFLAACGMGILPVPIKQQRPRSFWRVTASPNTPYFIKFAILRAATHKSSSQFQLT
ncbi:MAG: hypothetical protein HC879_16980 [Leptolyngbyaceae cyanobacterium SL_5_9]|nr:hypothetical protein [Leptolyngbyaceae cyanobacterium SM1_4_3]NJN59063.1 hypothetical protein [Leptolyngbyaceae cyanobacterium SL_5_9]NJO75836.1 hypothetical protein [Leptolyngbyaceae cyanobacterium RM1_406_9]